MKVVVTGGGSGGHIYPALAIIDGLQRHVDSLDILYIGAKRGLEQDVVPRHQIKLVTIHAKGLLVPGYAAKLSGMIAALRGLWEALRILRQFRPQVVVGTGGYVCGPVGVAAVMLGIPLVLQEQNVWPGFTNRKLAPWAASVLVPYEEARRNFPPKTQIRVVNNPVSIRLTESRDEARQKLGLDPDVAVLLATGGSQGAMALNHFLTSWLPRLLEHSEWGLLWMTGKRYYPEVMRSLATIDLDPKRIQVVEYFYEIQTYLRASDVFLGRAGAMSLEDCVAFGLPAVLVPSPNVSEDHQTRNAEVFVKRGAGYLVRESQLMDQGAATLERMLGDHDLRGQMSRDVRALYNPHAESDIVEEILKVAKG